MNARILVGFTHATRRHPGRGRLLDEPTIRKLGIMRNNSGCTGLDSLYFAMQSEFLVLIRDSRSEGMSTEEPGKKRAGNPGWFSELDSLLRGDLTRVSSLRAVGSSSIRRDCR